MAEYISFQPRDYFNTTIYSGDNGTQAITGVGFQPDFIWEAKRSATGNKYIFDAVRGVGSSAKQLETSSTAGNSTQANMIQSFDADGYTQGSDMNASGTTYVSWNWKLGTTSGISGGTLTPTSYSINTTSGIGIYQYDGSGTNGATIAHGLGAAPEMVMLKRTDGTAAWYTGHNSLNNGTTPWNYGLFLNTTADEAADTGFYNTAPTSSVVTLGNVSTTNNSGQAYVMYAFAGKSGYSKFGGYEGNGNADGTFVYTGFRPAFLLIKNVDSTGGWLVYDDKRDGYNVDNAFTNVNNNASSEGSNKDIILASNGFKPVVNDNDTNGSYSYIYAAFAEFPLVSSNDIPGVAR